MSDANVIFLLPVSNHQPQVVSPVPPSALGSIVHPRIAAAACNTSAESISLTKEKIPVRIDGKISLPLIDDIQAAGLTPLQMKTELTKRLKGFVDNPIVTVTVMEANSFKVYVSGEVKQPGIVRIRSEVTLVKLIVMVGGFTEWANKRKILIITREKGADKRITVNYNKIIDGDEPDIVINRGDTVIVK